MSGPIPIDALEAAHWLVVGTTGSGKTYLARGLFEQLRCAGGVAELKAAELVADIRKRISAAPAIMGDAS